MQSFKDSVAEKMGTGKSLAPFRYNGQIRFEVKAVEPRDGGFLGVLPDKNGSYRTFLFDKIQSLS